MVRMAPPDTTVSPASRGIRRLAVGVTLGALATLVAVGVPAGKSAPRDAGPNLTTAPDAQTFPAHTCLNWQRPDAVDAKAVSCSQPHLFEVTATLELQDFGAQAAFPAPGRWQQLVTQRCTPFITQALADHFDPFGRFTVGAIKPSGAGWVRGDRTLHCGVQSVGHTGTLLRTTGSALAQDQSDVHQPGTCLGNNGKAVGDPVNCTGPPAIEVVGVVDLKGVFPQEYPDEAAQDRVLNSECTRLARDFSGGPTVVANKGLTLFWETLRPESWRAGSTRVDCRLGAFLPDRSGFAPVRGDVRGPVQIGKQPAPAAPPEVGPAPGVTPPVTEVDTPTAPPP